MISSDWNCKIDGNCPVGTLCSLTTDFIVNNLAVYANADIDLLKMLPPHIKNRILRRLTASSRFWHDVDFKNVLSAVIHDSTQIVDLTSAMLDDDMLNILTSSKTIRKMYLSRTKGNLVTTTGLINLLSHTPKLYLLVLSHCDAVVDDVLKCLAEHCPQLMGLDIGECKNVTDCGIKHLSRLKNLTWSTLSQTQISDEGITTLVKGESGSKIKELRIDNCPNITKTGLQAISQYCPNLEVLIFYNCSRDLSSVQHGSFKNLKQMMWTVSWSKGTAQALISPLLFSVHKGQSFILTYISQKNLSKFRSLGLDPKTSKMKP